MVPSMQWLSFDSLSDHNTALLRSPKLEPGICVMKDSAAKRIAIPCALLLSILFAATGSLFAQQPTQPLPAPQVEMVQLNLPENMEIKTLVDYVSDRLGISIVYDETIQGKQITVRAPNQIPVTTLQSLLQSALRMKGLALVKAGTPGWYRVVEANQLSDVAAVGLGNAENDSVPITETFALEYSDPQQIDEIVKPFLTQPGANSVVVPQDTLLIVTDYADNLQRIRNLIESLDRPEEDLLTDFYTVENLAAQDITTTVSSILAAGGAKGEAPDVQLLSDERTNQITLVGTEDSIATAKQLLERFDKPLGLQTKVYQFSNVSADRINTIFQELIDPLQRKIQFQATVDSEANLLVARTTPEIHERLRQLQDQLDVAPNRSQSPVRFVRLKHASVQDVLRTLRDVGQAQAAGASAPQQVPPLVPVETGGPGELPDQSRLDRELPVKQAQFITPVVPAGPLTPLQLPLVPEDATNARGRFNTREPVGGGAILPGGVRISGDPTTNSIVLVGSPSAQAAYLRLIEELDARRPQVMIEAHIVAVDTSNNFSLGVEVSGGDRSGATRLFAFTSFGLSEVDPVTGALQIIPNIGFNGTLVDPNVADAVVQALATNSRAEVLASPKVLVNDNTRGRFQNVLSVPFQSVNASQTVSTTSLGGSQQAGTTIDVVPHIKENNELELEFSVEFSSFAGDGNAALPPPRQISSTDSTVTIPDGHTVIVGGLKQVGTNESYAGIPYLERIPIIRTLTGLQSESLQTTSFFLFIKPVVIRDDRFSELKYLSKQETRKAGIRGRFPRSEPLMYRVSEIDCATAEACDAAAVPENGLPVLSPLP